jgi:hypothetical protein
MTAAHGMPLRRRTVVAVAWRSVARKAGLLAAALVVAVPAAAFAAGALPYDAAQTNPQQSQNYVAGPGPASFTVVSPDCPGASLFVDVANQNVFGPDDRLIESARKEHFPLAESLSSPGTYIGQATAQWLSTPGTYYWHASGAAKCDAAFEIDRVSPVRSIVINAAPTPPDAGAPPEVDEDSALLTINQAKGEIPGLILKRTKKVARGLKRKCSRRGEGSLLVVACTVSWHDNKKYNYNGSMRLALNDDGTLSVRFDGRRATKSCVKRKGGKKCFKKWVFKYDSV